MSVDWPVPKKLSELRELDVKRKGEWEGAGWWLAALVWLLYLGPLVIGVALSLLFGPGWSALILLEILTVWAARRFMTEFHTVWFGVIWTTSGAAEGDAERIMEHEGVHDWHQQRVPGYLWKYPFPVPMWRREAEGLAYALDVLRGRRTLEDAAESFSDWIYFQFLTKKKATAILERCMAKWTAGCDDVF